MFTIKYLSKTGKIKSINVSANTTDDAIDAALVDIKSNCQRILSALPKAEPKVKLPRTNRSIEDLLG